MLSGGPAASEQSRLRKSMPGSMNIDVSGMAASGAWTNGSPECTAKGARVASKNNDRRTGRHDVTIVYLFDAPRELVFRNWIDAAGLSTWFAPDGCTVTLCAVDARPGGKWRVEYRCELGGTYAEYGEFHEIVAPERLAFS